MRFIDGKMLKFASYATAPRPLPGFTIFICFQSYGNSLPQSKHTTYVFVERTLSARPECCESLVVMGNEQCLWEQQNSELTNLNIVTSVARLPAAIVDEVELGRKLKIGRDRVAGDRTRFTAFIPQSMRPMRNV